MFESKPMVSNTVLEQAELETDAPVEGTSAVEALDKGFADLMDLCDVVAHKFMEAREEHSNTMEQ